MKFSPRLTILVIYAITILFSVVSICFALGDQKQSMAIYIVLILFLALIVVKTDILFTHKKKSKEKGKK